LSRVSGAGNEEPVRSIHPGYERSAARRDTRAGHYERNLQTKVTKAGEVRLKG
jgi:hypothetical protein